VKETEVAAAIAAQEEYIRRMRACPDQAPMGHEFAPSAIHRAGEADFLISRCTLCGVTETREDYDALIRLQGTTS
jgi:hypothetical protein